MHRIKSQPGFTLIEIIIVISIVGIVGGIASLVIGRTLDAYAALERREKLQTSIRLAIERMSREIRFALPHSICVYDGANCSSTAQNRFYMIPVKESGKYQDSPGAYSAPPPVQRQRLPVSPISRDRFDVLSTNGLNRLNASAGDWVVVYNLDNATIYTGTADTRKQIQQINQVNINNTPSLNDDIDQIQFSGNVSFANHSPNRRFHIIRNDEVTLFYLNGSTLYRDTTTFANPSTPGANPRILMENVQAASFTYTPGTTQRAGLLKIDITASLQGELVQVIHDAHVYNTP